MATLTFNMRDRELFVDGTDVEVTRREWQVALTLATGGRLTDIELGHRVWADECKGDYAGWNFRDLARAQIRGLRSKGVPIHSRRTMGYKLDGEIEVLE